MALTPSDKLRQYIAAFIGGPNANAVIDSMGDSAQYIEDLSVQVGNQLSISTASGVYLDKRLADKGIVRPADLGMSDLSFRQLGIKIANTALLSELIQSILETFYGFAAVRANLTSTLYEPFQLTDGMDFIFSLEDGAPLSMTFHSTDFVDISQATAEEVAGAITRFLLSQNRTGLAQTYTDINTNHTYVQMFGGARGPYSTVSVLGGQAQLHLQFPILRDTAVGISDTVWQVTFTGGNTLRFRWIGNSQPNLIPVLPGDTVLLYGEGFVANGLQGTYTVTNVSPADTGVTSQSGWFEISLPTYSGLKYVPADTIPPPNSYPNIYSIDIMVSNALDVFFFAPDKALPNAQPRYALAWEATKSTLKVYMPATTDVVARELEGASHIHLGKTSTDLNGVFGSATDLTQQIELVSDRDIRYPQSGYDNIGLGGVLTWGANTVAINRVERENFTSTVYCDTPHGIPGYTDAYGRDMSTTIVSVAVADTPQDDPTEPFLGPYIVDTAANYALESEFCFSRAEIFPGATMTTLAVDGVLPNVPGLLLFDLGYDSQESGVPFTGVQSVGTPTAVDISTISQTGFTMTVVTVLPHGAVGGGQVEIAGTTHFNGVYVVGTVVNATTYIVTSGVSQTFFETDGTSTSLVSVAQSILLIDPSYVFKQHHLPGASITLISQATAYIPAKDGSDYSTYITGTATGRIFAQEVIEMVAALGINLNIVIVYASDVGFGNQGDGDGPALPESDIVWIYG
jgi:hypothetical protein